MTEQELLLGDVAGVVQVQRGKLDEAYLRRWAKDLAVTAELEAVASAASRGNRKRGAHETGSSPSETGESSACLGAGTHSANERPR